MVSRNPTRYHIEAATAAGADDYVSSWLSFEFKEAAFAELMADHTVDLERVELAALFLDSRWIAEVLTRPFWEIGVGWVLEHDAIAVAPLSHWEGVYVLNYAGEPAELVRGMTGVT